MMQRLVLSIQLSMTMDWLNAELVDNQSQLCRGVIAGDDFTQVCAAFLRNYF